jgi:hypothetical protein
MVSQLQDVVAQFGTIMKTGTELDIPTGWLGSPSP